jgi:hypothetical protein
MAGKSQGMTPSIYLWHIAAATLAAAVLACSSVPLGAAPRASEASCRQAVNGLISLIDAGSYDTALYRDTYAVVVKSCGPASRPAKTAAPPPSRDQCHALAAALVDLIEDDRMNTAAFVEARGDFAAACGPR